MSNIEFEGQHMSQPAQFIQKPRGFSAYLIKNGWAHDGSSANKLMIFIAILFVLASAIVYFLLIRTSSDSGSIDIPNHVLERLPLETREKIRNAQQ